LKICGGIAKSGERIAESGENGTVNNVKVNLELCKVL
jgi:hypothetical protein